MKNYIRVFIDYSNLSNSFEYEHFSKYKKLLFDTFFQR